MVVISFISLIKYKVCIVLSEKWPSSFSEKNELGVTEHSTVGSLLYVNDAPWQVDELKAETTHSVENFAKGTLAAVVEIFMHFQQTMLYEQRSGTEHVFMYRDGYFPCFINVMRRSEQYVSAIKITSSLFMTL